MIYLNNLVRGVKKELSHCLLGGICRNAPRSITKFVCDMVWGILASGDSRVSRISRMLFERNIRITENRLTRNLMELDLAQIKREYPRYAFDRPLM